MTSVFVVVWSTETLRSRSRGAFTQGWTVHSTRERAQSADFGFTKLKIEEAPCSTAAAAFLTAIEQGVADGRVQGRVPGMSTLAVPAHFYLQHFAAPIPELSGIDDPEAHEIALIAFRDSVMETGAVFPVGH